MAQLRRSAILALVLTYAAPGPRVTGATMPGEYAGPTTIDAKECPCYTADWGNAGIYRQRLLWCRARRNSERKRDFAKVYKSLCNH